MDIKEKILLNENRSVNSINVDTATKIQLANEDKLSLEYDIQNVLDVTQVFDDERQATETYRIHGEFEYLSILNGLITNYTTITDFFTRQPVSADTKNILTDFDFYLVRPSTGFTELIEDQRYIKNYEVISVLSDIEINRAGYASNIFDEQQYSFIFTIDIDISNDVDGLGFPLTEIYIYAQYKPGTNGNNAPEQMQRKTYDASGNTQIILFNPVDLNVGDTLEGDVINYNKVLFQQTDYNLQQYYIDTPFSTPYNDTIRWRYTPFIPVRLRYFEPEVITGNDNTTSNDVLISIPSYATPIDDDGNFVWKNIQEKGFFDPITGDGVSFPFINNKHYVFQNVVLAVKPELDDSNTFLIFENIKYGDNEVINTVPNSDLNNIGDIC